MIAEMTGTAVESTARFSGADQAENLNNFDAGEASTIDSKYRGAQGLDPDIIKEIEENVRQMDKPAHIFVSFNMMKRLFNLSILVKVFFVIKKVD